MREYKRITVRTPKGIKLKKGRKYVELFSDKSLTLNALNYLSELEDEIESGRMVELPCKVGDTVYCVEYFCNYKGCSSNEQMFCCGCPEMLERERKKQTYFISEKKFKLEDLSKINKTLYITKESAEARLKELREGK